MILAILYVEIADDFESVTNQLNHISLQNCKQIAAQLTYNEVIVRVECKDQDSLHRAITHEFRRY